MTYTKDYWRGYSDAMKIETPSAVRAERLRIAEGLYAQAKMVDAEIDTVNGGAFSGNEQEYAVMDVLLGNANDLALLALYGGELTGMTG